MATGSAMTEPYGREGLPLEQARATILEHLQPLGLRESLPLAACLGRTTGAAVLAPAAVPGFRASIMDGYAIAGGAVPAIGTRWSLVGVSAAGTPYGSALAAGEAVRILTGAVVPEGSERVLPQELVGVVGEGEELELFQPCGPNTWIRHPQEEAAPGQELVPAGQRLGAADLGRLASCGLQELVVTRRPRVGLLISGDELLQPGLQRGPGQIWESNSTLLCALLQRLGYVLAEQRVVVDQPEPLRIALRDLAQSCDVVVGTGGVSAGDSDWIRPLVDELGEVRFWKLFLKPGRPFAWGQLAGVPFFGLPGNPVAAAITALQLLWPALQRLEGAELQLLPRLKVQLEAPLRRGAGRPELARAQLAVAADGGLSARVAGSQASSRIGSLQGADLLLEIPAELGSLEAGTELWAQLLRLPVF
ncbi:molybdopterin molybdotransferase MoeA [Synechococcus sp. HJ21-Hayes]|uniref:molybdopterin molybdotransferase MoeA n=1 Tax=unclassified Synechococcus TaxID=2626047 RepID=UPI0020CBA438|nr:MULTISPECIES: molybdopterin molybdotransferase MoeA [unclassified Synechococcus]MCP9831320.1 molybdopterin molybdotransferase MoeA [Synechococcus sp. JJ3a-Johnson]MCP9853596.1 molybdopterin molybdotransferase MoeA [Synechococcus sp. HJ21-Hayes]